MTDIGAAILRLLNDRPEEWAFRPICDGLYHESTGISVTPSVPNRVLVFVYSIDHTAALSDEDHAPLAHVANWRVDAHKRAQSPAVLADGLRKALGMTATSLS